MSSWPKLRGIEVSNPLNNGHEAMDTAAKSFWQSRMCQNGERADPPEIIHPVEILKRGMQQ